ncbi:uncharacterized protein B0H18DRAFT_1005149 [Fomitopsis serialis]|uniref:uncharacterized protein n=1 Tax=Fomitopsis serialis TaxID=139415 RepID=UPI0020071E86|nr:uncharacterized protein B0H18DRAFT_1005149 [Neoantrodia serialis]KAH9926693.1 hypothetical protein B0H18DRAFT_1005149 [Neoantrodia serialis]
MTIACVTPTSSRVQEANMLGMALSMLAYGAHAAFFSNILRHFLRPLSSRLHGKFFACTCLLFVLATLSIILQLVCDVKIFFGDSGGLNVGGLFTTYTPANNLSLAVTLAYLILHWSSDAILLWRCSAIYEHSPLVWVPCSAILVGLIVTGSYFVHDLTGLVMTWTGTLPTPGLVYIAVTLCFNVLLPTVMIARVFRFSWNLRGIWRTRDSRGIYSFVISTILESAAFYAAVAIITIVAVAIDTSMQAAILPLLGQMQAIPSLLLTARAMDRRDVPEDPMRQTALTSLQFNCPDALEKASTQPGLAPRPESRTKSPCSLDSIVIVTRQSTMDDERCSGPSCMSGSNRWSRDEPIEVQLAVYIPDSPASYFGDDKSSSSSLCAWEGPQCPPMALLRS